MNENEGENRNGIKINFGWGQELGQRLLKLVRV